MRKECWQLSHPKEQTRCFKETGRTSCSTPDCAVEQSIQEFESKGEEVDYLGEQILSHSTCRISSESANNQEYLERTGQAGPLKFIKQLYLISKYKIALLKK